MSDSSGVELDESSPSTLKFKAHGPYVGNVELAKKARVRLLEIIRSGAVAKFDVDGVAVMTPSFVNEALGLIVDELGVEVFKKSVVVKNANEACVFTVEAVLQQRLPPLSEAEKRVAAEEEAELEQEEAKVEAEAQAEEAAEEEAAEEEATADPDSDEDEDEDEDDAKGDSGSES